MRVTNIFKSNSDFLGRLFTEKCLASMLQASEYEAIDKTSSFFGVYVVEIRGIHKKALIKTVLTKYVDVVNFTYRRLLCPEWNEAKLISLQKQIISFKKAAIDCFH